MLFKLLRANSSLSKILKFAEINPDTSKIFRIWGVALTILTVPSDILESWFAPFAITPNPVLSMYRTCERLMIMFFVNGYCRFYPT